jgi:glycine dehydrogenase subunit 1
MTFTPHTYEERQQMLDAIGVKRMEDLFDDVPIDVRFPELDVPPALSELELASEMRAMAAHNLTFDDTPSFLAPAAIVISFQQPSTMCSNGLNSIRPIHPTSTR